MTIGEPMEKRLWKSYRSFIFDTTAHRTTGLTQSLRSLMTLMSFVSMPY